MIPYLPVTKTLLDVAITAGPWGQGTHYVVFVDHDPDDPARFVAVASIDTPKEKGSGPTRKAAVRDAMVKLGCTDETALARLDEASDRWDEYQRSKVTP